MAKMKIDYLDIKTIEVEIPDAMVKEWENGDCFSDDIIREIVRTNQVPLLVDPGYKYCGRIHTMETYGGLQYCENDERIDGDDW